MGDAKSILHDCLYFTAGALARQLSALAESCFKPTGLNPSQGFALMCIVDEPGISPSQIAERLALAPSSVTRIVEALQRAGFVTTESVGRRVSAFPTDQGQHQHQLVMRAWAELHEAYSQHLGKEHGDALCGKIHEATLALARTTDQE